MSEQLTIRELACYSAFELKVFNEYENREETLVGLTVDRVITFGTHKTITNEFEYSEIKPLLRPLSDLTKEIEHNGDEFVPIEVFIKMRSSEAHVSDKLITALTNGIKTKRLDYEFMVKLLEWHFDVFGLIPRNLALPIKK